MLDCTSKIEIYDSKMYNNNSTSIKQIRRKCIIVAYISLSLCFIVYLGCTSITLFGVHHQGFVFWFLNLAVIERHFEIIASHLI